MGFRLDLRHTGQIGLDDDLAGLSGLALSLSKTH